MEGGPPNAEFRRELSNVSDKDLLGQLHEIAPDVYERTDKTQRKRIIRALEIAHSRTEQGREPAAKLELDPLLLGPFYPRPVIHRRIEERLDQRLREGLLEEVESLNSSGIPWDRLEALGLEYRYAARRLQGQLSQTEFRNQLLAKIRQFCRSQEIWFRKMEREGKVIHWVPEGDVCKATNLARTFLAGKKLPEPEIQLKNIRYGPDTNK